MNDATKEARRLLDERFGIGRDEAHAVLRSNVAAKRIYDCAVAAIADILDPAPPPPLRLDEVDNPTPNCRTERQGDEIFCATCTRRWPADEEPACGLIEEEGNHHE